MIIGITELFPVNILKLLFNNHNHHSLLGVLQRLTFCSFELIDGYGRAKVPLELGL
jgi:hypothetical protein